MRKYGFITGIEGNATCEPIDKKIVVFRVYRMSFKDYLTQEKVSSSQNAFMKYEEKHSYCIVVEI